ncbi:hypothetical protein ABH935_010152 [Catenulispora sp. GAS73]|uniref:hypothetical protein n=1 Tax=Catenulispora sp. GAS73 TaxID=3156269 RepID=UPI003513FC16
MTAPTPPAAFWTRALSSVLIAVCVRTRLHDASVLEFVRGTFDAGAFADLMFGVWLVPTLTAMVRGARGALRVVAAGPAFWDCGVIT